MTASLNEAIAAEEPRLKRLAYRYVDRNGAELDDLVQEGRIAIWQSLERDVHPSNEFIENRMKMWIRHLGGQLPADYEDMLPLEALEPHAE